jgi:uncharacterized protein YqfA (UPF0365 family)
MSGNEIALLVVALTVVVFAFILFLLFMLLGRSWIKAITSGAPVSIFMLMGMLLRGTPRRLVVDAYIQLHHRGSPATIQDVELRYIANRHRIRSSGDLVDFVEQSSASAPAG